MSRNQRGLVLEVIIVRWQLIGEGRTGTIERQCARLAEQIWTGKVAKRKGMLEALSELYLADNEFQSKFALQENFSNQKAVYWPAPGSEDTELGVLMEPEVGHGETEIYAGVQA